MRLNSIKQLLKTLSTATVVFIFSSCEYKTVKTDSSSEMPTEVKAILESKCVECHSGPSAPNGFNFVLNVSQMLSAGYISPGDYEDSLLYQKMSTSPPFGERMPKSGSFLTSTEMQTIADWLDTVGVTPAISINSPTEASYIDTSNNSATFAVTGACNVRDSVITIEVNGTPTGAGATCDGTSFSAQVDSTGAPFVIGANTIMANMVDVAQGIDLDSTVINVTKDLTVLSIAITSSVNTSAADRDVGDPDNSFITSANNSTTFAVSGLCNATGRTVTITVDGSTAATTTCDGVNFSTTINTTTLSNATHKMVATVSNAGGESATSTVYLYKWSAAPTVSFATDVVPLFTVPRPGNQRACIDCHYIKLAGTPSSNFSFGIWSACVGSGGGKPVGAAGACADTSATTPYATDPDNTERQAFVFKLGYYKYTSTTAASNEGGYANRAFSIVNDKTEASNWVANRIVRGNPSQSFVYMKLTGANTLCYDALSVTPPVAQDKGCKTSQGTVHGQMPRYDATYVPNYFTAGEQLTIYTWIMEGARTDN